MDLGAAQLHVDGLLDVFGVALLDHEHGALAGAEAPQLLGHQGIDHVENQQRHPRGAEHIGEAEPLQRPQQAVGEAAHDDDADVVEFAGDRLVEPVVADEGLCRRHPAFHLEALVNEGHGRVGEPRIVEAGRAGQAVEA